MPRKKQTFQTVNGPVTVNVPLSAEMEAQLKIVIDHSGINRKWLDVPYGPLDDELMDIYLPNEGEGPFPVLLAIHGGGWREGDKDYLEVHSAFKAVQMGFAVASIRYRLIPKHPHPAQIHDVKAAIRFLRANAAEYNLDPNRIAAFGGSAGGHLAALAGTSANRPELTDLSLGNPDVDESLQAVVDWYGPIWLDRTAKDFEKLGVYTDAQQAGPEFSEHKKALFACAEEEYPAKAAEFSPATYITKDCPPFLIQHGTKDPLVPYLQSVDFDRALSAVIGEENVTLDLLHNQGHGSFVFESIDNMMRVTDWLKDIMGIERN